MAEEKKKKPLKKFDDLLDEAWKTYLEKFSLVVGVSGVPAAIGLLGSLIVGGAPFMGTLTTVFGVVGWVIVVTAVLAFLIMPPALVYALEKGVEVFDAYLYGIDMIQEYAWLVLLMALAVAGGLGIWIIPGIVCAIWISLAPYVFVAEGKRGLAALGRSRELMNGYWLAAFVRFCALAILMGGATFAFWLLYLLARLIGATAPFLLFVKFLYPLLIVPYAVLFGYHLYKNVREVKGDELKGSAGFRALFAVVALAGLAVLTAFVWFAIRRFFG
ncbi:MAG: hypothetical protein HY536_01070 [Candidatus Colwellbacteria bacterium]|nr:hypothetical protein [Candidatus Colwellbacteria bacterium]